MRWAAVVLAGGHATRLDGMDKAGLVGADGRTTLRRTVDACAGAARIVVVGPPGDDDRVVWTREMPAFTGPARAIAAGVEAIDVAGVEWTVVLSCDIPEVGQVVPALVRATKGENADGIVTVARARRQWLCAVYRLDRLREACAALPPGGGDESARRLVSGLRLVDLPVPERLVVDLDTPEDLADQGFSPPALQ